LDPVSVLRAFGETTDARALLALSSALRVVQQGRIQARQAVRGPATDFGSALSCPRCPGSDARSLVADGQSGDVVCTLCGVVVADHSLHEGIPSHGTADEEGGPDPSHWNKPAEFDYLMSEGYQLQTFACVAAGAPAATPKTLYVRDEDDPRSSTTERCRDRDKRSAITAVRDAGARLGLSAHVCKEALEVFAAVRDGKERLESKRLVLAACLLACFQSRHRRRAVAMPFGVPGLPCVACGSRFLTASRRIAHWDGSPACKHASLRSQLGVRVRATMDDPGADSRSAASAEMH